MRNFSDLTKYALPSIIFWGLSIGLLIVISIIYIIQTMQMNRNGDKKLIRNLGNVIGGLGIGMCIIGIGWIISLVYVAREAHNIWADASSLYVSRNNLLLNWFNPITAPAGTWPANGDPPTNTAVPIYAFPPKDGVAVCYSTWKDTRDNGFNKYRELISYYNGKGNTMKQAYFKPADSAHPKHYVAVEEDTLENQRALTLAYYRFIYCTQKYMTMIYNGQVATSPELFSFLPAETVTRLKENKHGCTKDTVDIPDTKFCIDSDWPLKSNKCVAKNPCFAALTESIAAQCLLYDDLVYKTQHSSAAGALKAFGVLGSDNNPAGIQVWDGVSA